MKFEDVTRTDLGLYLGGRIIGGAGKIRAACRFSFRIEEPSGLFEALGGGN